MKDTIYTIPLTDAFKEEGECPFCSIERTLEKESIAFTLGSSYMEDDIREITDRLGFCKIHYKKLYDYGNKLGLAIILETRYKHLQKQLEHLLDETSIPKTSWFDKVSKGKLSNTTENSISPIQSELESCYICDRIEKNMTRYMETFCYLLSSNEEFKSLFLNSTGFCLTHFSKLLQVAPYALKEKDKEMFLSISQKMLEDSFERIHDDLSWFIDKYDHTNHDKPWKNAKDAIPRGIQQITGTYVDEPVFKENI